MDITDQHIDYIQRDLELRGITMSELNESLIDHICCTIENSTDPDFNSAYLDAIKIFGAHEISNIQKQTSLLLITKNSIIMNKIFFILSFLAAFLTSTGVLCIIMHWPGAGAILVSGIAVFNFGVLPMYFIDRYKQSAIQ